MKKQSLAVSFLLLTVTLASCGPGSPPEATADLSLVLKNVQSAHLQVANSAGKITFDDTVTGSKVLTGLPRAVYSITSSDTDTATAPAVQQGDLTSGNSSVTLVYTPKAFKTSLTVVLKGPTKAMVTLKDSSGTTVYTGSVTDGQVIDSLPRGQFTLTAAASEGYAAPAPQPVDLSNGTATINLSYVVANFQSEVLKFSVGTFNTASGRGTAAAVQLRLPSGTTLPSGSSAAINGPMGWNNGQPFLLPLSNSRPVSWAALADASDLALAGEYTATLVIGDQKYKSQVSLNPAMRQTLPGKLTVTPSSRTSVFVDFAAVAEATTYALKLINAQGQEVSNLSVSKNPRLGISNLNIDISAPYRAVVYALNADITSNTAELPAQFNVSTTQAPLNFTGFGDDTFGVKGVATLPSNKYFSGYRTFKQLADGSLLAAGQATIIRPDLGNSSQHGISLIRLHADGTQDTAYGSQDGVLLGYPAGAVQDYDVGASDIAVLADGSLALALSGNNLMARVLPNGRPDTAFGQGGSIGSPFLINGTRIAALPKGGFIVAGTKFRTTNFEPDKMVVLKLDKTGQPDQSFGTQGVVILDNADRYAQIGALVVDASGNVTVAGKVGGIYDPNGMLFSSDQVLVVRLNAAGQPDSTFGDGGRKLLSLRGNGENINRMLLLPGGQLLLGGLIANGANYLTDYLLIKLNSNGQLDTSFGLNGVAQADSGDQYDEVRGMALQTDGKIIATGPTGLTRFTAMGQLDTSFGVDGFVKRGGDDLADGQDVEITSAGKVIVFSYETIRRLLP